MIYFDNAATTKQKPEAVVRAVVDALTEFGGVGRGVHGAALAAGMAVYEARESVAKLLGTPGADRVSFTANVTESLNLVLNGLLCAGDHVITTAASHNSILRPLYRLEKQGVEVSIVPVGAAGGLDWAAYEAAFRSNTKLVAATHASNLTGDVYDIARMARMAHAHGALMVVDAAQTAGAVPINMAGQAGFAGDDAGAGARAAITESLDILCFTGHKALYGPQGTGGVALAAGIEVPPLKVGGSGTHTFSHEHPSAMPEGLEAGTLNGHGIAGLGAGVDFVLETGVEAIAAHEVALANRLVAGTADIPGIRFLGAPFAGQMPEGTLGKTGIVALTMDDADPGRIADRLHFEYGICTRAGAHCAPLMHEALGTADSGAVRFSFSWFNTEAEVDQAIAALHEIAASC